MARLVKDIVAELKQKQEQFDKKQDRDELKECVESYEMLLNDSPENPEIIFQLGTAHLQLGKFGTALPFLDRILDFWPTNAHVWSNIGCCYRALHDLPRARDAFAKSLMSEPKADTFSNLASCYVNENCPEQGIEFAEKALEMDADNIRARWNLSLLLLELQEYDKGFTLYDTGFLCNERTMRNYTVDETPWWDGTFNGQTVVFWDEQGIGDRLLACARLNELKGQNIKVILECHPRLEKIYNDSFPWVEAIYPTSKDEYVEWSVDHDISAKYPLMSLGRYFTMENDEAYLKPDADLIYRYRREFEQYGPGPYYAFTWKGGAMKTSTTYRTLKLGWYKEAIEQIGGTWISMQYHEDAPDKAKRFREETNLPVYHCSAAQEYDYSHTLAALAAVDHTITVCNSVVHTCGGAGLPCTVLVPQRRAWRYPKGDTFPWYSPNVRMIHQSDVDDWRGILKQLTEVFDSGSGDHRTRSIAAG